MGGWNTCVAMLFRKLAYYITRSLRENWRAQDAATPKICDEPSGGFVTRRSKLINEPAEPAIQNWLRAAFLCCATLASTQQIA